MEREFYVADTFDRIATNAITSSDKNLNCSCLASNCSFVSPTVTMDLSSSSTAAVVTDKKKGFSRLRRALLKTLRG